MSRMYTYSFVSSGYMGEDTYYAYENSGQLAASKVDDLRFPSAFLEWWADRFDFDNPNFSFRTEESINTAFTRWIVSVIKPRLYGELPQQLDKLDELVRKHYEKCARGLKAAGVLSQLTFLLTHGTPVREITETGRGKKDDHG